MGERESEVSLLGLAARLVGARRVVCRRAVGDIFRGGKRGSGQRSLEGETGRERKSKRGFQRERGKREEKSEKKRDSGGVFFERARERERQGRRGTQEFSCCFLLERNFTRCRYGRFLVHIFLLYRLFRCSSVGLTFIHCLEMLTPANISFS